MSTIIRNVHFVCVARVAGKATITASFAHHHTQVELDAVRQVLEQPNMNLSLGTHYSFTTDQCSWNFMTDDKGLIYIVICKAGYPSRCAVMCLDELQRKLAEKFGDRARTAGDRSMDKLCSGLFLTVCQKYDNVAELDSLASVARKVDTVKLVMQENLDAALQNCVKLESIELASEELQRAAGVFRVNANNLRNKMWWKNMKMRLIVGGVVLVILGIIIAIIVTMT